MIYIYLFGTKKPIKNIIDLEKNKARYIALKLETGKQLLNREMRGSLGSEMIFKILEVLEPNLLQETADKKRYEKLIKEHKCTPR